MKDVSDILDKGFDSIKMGFDAMGKALDQAGKSLNDTFSKLDKEIENMENVKTVQIVRGKSSFTERLLYFAAGFATGCLVLWSILTATSHIV